MDPGSDDVIMTGGEEILGPGSRFGVTEDLHELGSEIGSGAAARVYVCRRINTGEELAAKVINLQKLRLMGDFDSQLLKLNREVQILRELSHPRIVNLHNVHKTNNFIYLVMERVSGGELFNQIVQNRTLNEVEAQFIFRQLLEGVSYMHSKHVIHRDLKPENILIVSTRMASPPLSGKLHDVKIADFGLSKIIREGTSFAKTFVGTPQYWAPEVLSVQGGHGTYTQAVDLWSLGAVLFVMFCGRYPFDGKKMPLEEQIRTATFNLNAAAWQKVSEEAKEIVRGLLRVNPSERMTLQDCASHAWLSGVREHGTDNHAASLAVYPKHVISSPVVTVGSQSSNNAGATPVVTQTSNVSDISGRSASVEVVPPPQDKGSTQRPVPSIHVAAPMNGGMVGGPGMLGADGGAAAAAKETIFCLNELLKLQVSIAGSLEIASLAFRHADLELSDAIKVVFRQARDLSTVAANIISQYAQVAQQVSQSVLPDLQLAVQEKEPSLAVALLGMVKGWVCNMKKDGEEIQRRYVGLQESVHNLIKRAQMTKTDADRRLAQAVQDAELEPPSAASSQFLALGAECKFDAGNGSTSSASAATGAPQILSPSVGSGVGVDTSRGAINVPFTMNVWTRQLFEQLNKVQGGNAMPTGDKLGLDMPMLGNGNDQSSTSASGDAASEMMLDDETWKRDVLELLFMAPGVGPTQLPKVEAFTFAEEQVSAELMAAASRKTTACSDDFGRSNPGGSADVPMGEEASESNSNTGGRPLVLGPRPEDPLPEPADAGEMSSALVRYTPTASSPPAAEVVPHSSAALLRALRELKRVDEILLGCSAFWANMDGTVQTLAQMKEHTECLVNFASTSKPLKERFDQRLGEYTNFWTSLEGLCRQYCLDYQASSKRMYEVIREVADAADVIETANSAKMGMMAAMREKQWRHGYAMQV